MPVTLEELMARLPADEQREIRERTEKLKREYRALQELRKALGKSQAEVARKLGISQPSVAQMEKRRDWMLSTLANYVEALGGRLRLVVELPGKPPIHLESVEDLLDEDTEDDGSSEAAE